MRRLNPAARKQVKRRRVLPRWTRPTAIFAASLLVSGSIAFSGYWAVYSGQVAALTQYLEKTVVEASTTAGLVIEDVLVEGRNETTRKQIMLALDAHRDASILAYDPHAARARLIRLGWIENATVERRFPATIYVRILERRAMAIWQRKGRFVLVDARGDVIGREGLGRYGHLKIIVGDEAPRHAAKLLHMLSGAPNMMKRVTAAVWVGNRRWNLRLEDHIDVRLPEHNPEIAWKKLIALDQDYALLNRDITAVDLRIPDRLIVRMRPEAARRRRDGST
ncbi:MAG: cell division protein FtsQ/DivIB [Alphaproteobacteria bacterium]|jgi:cell division protein FtsQ